MPTLFEKVVRGDIDADIVYQDDSITAFRDINPQAPVHILVVPNKVVPTANDISAGDEVLVGHMMRVAADIARDEGIAGSGYRLIINCNDDGGQEIYHLHLHLLGGRPLGAMLPE